MWQLVLYCDFTMTSVDWVSEKDADLHLEMSTEGFGKWGSSSCWVSFHGSVLLK